MAGHPLRPATRRSLGEPLPHQQADRPRAQPPPLTLSTTITCAKWSYPVLATVSGGYPEVKGRLLTCYSPVRRSCTPKGLTARLACVKHAASVRPEPGSNSPLKNNPTPTTPKTGPQMREEKNPNQNTTLTKKLPESSFQSKEPNQPTTPNHPTRQPDTISQTGTKLIRRLYDTLLSSQESHTPTPHKEQPPCSP